MDRKTISDLSQLLSIAHEIAEEYSLDRDDFYDQVKTCLQDIGLSTDDIIDSVTVFKAFVNSALYEDNKK